MSVDARNWNVKVSVVFYCGFYRNNRYSESQYVLSGSRIREGAPADNYLSHCTIFFPIVHVIKFGENKYLKSYGESYVM